MTGVKKRKWSVWVLLFLVKSIADFVIYFIMADKVLISEEYSDIDSFVGMSVKTDFLLGVIALLGTAAMIKKVFNDGRFEIKYSFWTMSVFAFLTAVINLIKGVLYDTVLFNIEVLRLEAAGEEMHGHGAPALTALYFLAGFVYVIAALIMGITNQISYSSKKEKDLH